MQTFDVSKFREHFPVINQKLGNEDLVYFDNAATTQKPKCVIDAERDYYQSINANVHRAAHQLSAEATTKFEASRAAVAAFINANLVKEIIWTKGTTESINIIASSWGLDNLNTGDEVVLSYAEHHANIVPWQNIAKKTGAIIKVLPLDHKGRVDECLIESVISSRCKVVSCAHISNVVGKVNPIKKIIARAKNVGAVTVIDGAQALANIAIDVQKLNCDFYVFSSHKLYGPTGVGVLYGKESLLRLMSPYQFGGEMIKKVSFTGTSYNDLPFKFEAGTPNIAGVIAFKEAIEFIRRFKLNSDNTYKKGLTKYCYDALRQIKQVSLLFEAVPDIPLFSFTVKGEHQQDMAASLDSKGIAVRAGHHCAMPLMEYLGESGCIRASLAPYNTREEVDHFITSLKNIIDKNSDLAPYTVHSSFHQSAKEAELRENFSNLKSWDKKHRAIMLLGKSMERMDKEHRTEQSLIVGCESAAWLRVNKLTSGKYSLSGDSDAKIIRGLLAIVFAALNNKTSHEIIEFDMDEYFLSLGLMKHLSPSRGNGLIAIVERIYSEVQQ